MLTPEEQHILLEKGTEKPFSGEYRNYKAAGTYVCRQCGSPLYHSEDKFDSDCGRPSFDDAIPGAIHRVDDADGSRTEITCATCGGHLGHVFIGEHLTEKNTRHCVNSLSMKFIPDKVKDITYEVAVLGGGCFRCVEAVLQNLKGVVDVKSGYAGGKRQYPTYEQVSAGVSGHIEVVRVTFDPTIISYETLLKVFFTSHNPTSLDQQGGDVGEQYKSIIFYTTESQKDIAGGVIKTLDDAHVFDKPIVTEIRPLDKFRIAEGYHQDFYNQHQDKPYCQIVINPKLQKIKEEWSSFLKK